MKLNKDFIIFLLISFIFFYHFTIHNHLEKLFTKSYFKYSDIKRPLKKCSYKKSIGCIGLPSGHSEAITVFSILLYFYNFISLWLALLLIIIFSSQRIISGMHTLQQVIVGIILGYFYALLYNYFNLSVYSFFIIFCIGLIITIFSVYKLNIKINQSFPKFLINL